MSSLQPIAYRPWQQTASYFTVFAFVFVIYSCLTPHQLPTGVQPTKMCRCISCYRCFCLPTHIHRPRRNQPRLMSVRGRCSKPDYAVSHPYAHDDFSAPALAAPLNYVSPVSVPEQLKHFQVRNLDKAYEERIQKRSSVRRASAILTNLLGGGSAAAAALGTGQGNRTHTRSFRLGPNFF